MRRLAHREHQVDVQVVDNEVSADFKRTIMEDCRATYQLVPLNLHQRNISDGAIHTLNSHFYQC